MPFSPTLKVHVRDTGWNSFVKRIRDTGWNPAFSWVARSPRARKLSAGLDLDPFLLALSKDACPTTCRRTHFERVCPCFQDAGEMAASIFHWYLRSSNS